jgi:hypothetical protein
LLTHLKVRGLWLWTAVVAVSIAFTAVAASSATAQEESGAASAPAPAEPAEPGATAGPTAVVSTKRVVPKRRKVVRHRFQPWGRPSPRKVRQIIRIEARRWRIDPSSLARRVACESKFQWSANGGSYYGLLQFAPSTFYRGLSSIKSRQVALVRERTRKVREIRIVRYSDGREVRERGRKHRQKVVHVYAGTLPRRPEVTHGWTQLRIGAQAIRGVSAVSSSEWGCPA